MGLGLPRLISRFWLGLFALIPTAAALPSLLFGLAPGRMPWIEPGWIGVEWGRLQTLLFGGAGALILTSLLFLGGVFALTGLSAGATLGVVGRLGAGAIEWILWAADELVPVVDRLIEATGRGLGLLRDGLVREAERTREAMTALIVRREQRARRARTLERRGGPELSYEDELRESEECDEPVAVLEEPEPAAVAPGRKLRANEEPDIVDHDEQRRK